MKVIASMATVILCLWIDTSQANPTDDTPKINGGAYITAITTVRKVWIKSVAGKVTDLAETGKSIDDLGLRADDAGCPVFQYVKCRILVQASGTAKAGDALLRWVASPSVAPEVVLCLEELNRDDRQRRVQCEECLARLLPISVWGSLSDGRQSRALADIDPPPPTIPRLDRNVLTKIAEETEHAGLHKEAWKAFVEAVYAGAPSWIEGTPNEEAWFSLDRAELWQRAAENAWKAGERSLAYDYLAKFAIFGSEAQFDEAKETVKKWNAGKGKEAEPEISKAQRQKALKEVIRLYAELNAHPRALELIQTYRDWLDNPDELYVEYSKQWKAVLKSYGRSTENVVVFGVKVTDAVDPTTIRIPFACSPESVKEVKAKLAQMLETKK